jgi:UDP-glucose 4-epimerase
MAILVTGGAGYIGGATTWLLKKNGYEVVVIDNLSTGYRENLHPDAIFIEGDFSDAKLLNTILENHSISSVLHFAAKTSVPESVQNPLRYYEENYTKGLDFLRWVIENGIQNFVFSSTAAVYGEVTSSPTDESSPTSPTNPYGSSKLFFERALNDVFRSTKNFSAICLRYFNVAGATIDGKVGQRNKSANNVMSVLARVAAGNQNSFPIFGTDYETPDGSCIRDFIHVEDIATAHLLAIKKLQNAKSGHSYMALNLGLEMAHSVLDLVRGFEAITGKKIAVEQHPRRPGDISKILADSTKAKEELGWKPKYQSVDDLCRSALDWERANF